MRKGSKHTDPVEGRHATYRERADGHHRNRKKQRCLTATAVRVSTQQDAADRPRQEGQGEGTEGQQQGSGRVTRGEERPGEIDREIRIDGDVEPFERIAERGRDYELRDVLIARACKFFCIP